MAGDNRFVTEYFLAQNFTPKSGITPGSNNAIWMDCDQILARYQVYVNGITNYGKRWPSQNQIQATQGNTGEASSITSTSAYHDCIWDGNGYTMTGGGIVCSTHSGATTSDYVKIFNNSGVIGYMYRTGGIYWSSLTPNTTYYSRCFVVTSQGTFYGNEVIFTTLP